MDASSLELIRTLVSIPLWTERILFILVGVAGAVAIGLVATTRGDAFEAAGRQPKMVWVAILALSTLALLLRIPFVAWFGAVAVGIYYCDVRPHIANLLRGNSGW